MKLIFLGLNRNLRLINIKNRQDLIYRLNHLNDIKLIKKTDGIISIFTTPSDIKNIPRGGFSFFVISRFNIKKDSKIDLNIRASTLGYIGLYGLLIIPTFKLILNLFNESQNLTNGIILSYILFYIAFIVIRIFLRDEIKKTIERFDMDFEETN